MLSEADRNLGDGDHGLGMQRGLTAAKEKISATGIKRIEKAFNTPCMAMMSSVVEPPSAIRYA
ncbi:MAG: DAK2 domain-containing protein [Verrucomicrobiaceae bacterium]|nr:DAK2 domain-containing protein [Verrucomicrobiaceae bacterium]